MPGITSEVVRSALRLLEQKEAQVDALRSAVLAGEQSGESPLTLHDIAVQKERYQRSKSLKQDSERDNSTK